MLPARLRAVATALAASIVIGAGCGDSSDSSSKPSGDSLAAALADANTPPEAASSTTGAQPFYFSWVNTARLREIADLPDSSKEAVTDQRWLTPVGYAIGDPIQRQINVTDYGFDPFTDDRTVTIGQAPGAATRWDGVDTGGIEDAFGKLGFERRGDFIALGGEGEIVDSSIDENGAGPIGINRVETSGDSLALGAYEDPVEAALGKLGDPAGDTPGASAVADCLGDDAFMATIVDPQEGAADEVTLVGYGLEPPSEDSGPVPEVICAAGGDDGGSLDGLQSCMDDAFNGGGIDPATQTPFSSELGKAEIEQGDADGTNWVRASFEPPGGDSAPVGQIFTMLQREVFAGALGGDFSLSAAAQNATPAQIKALQGQGCDASG